MIYKNDIKLIRSLTIKKYRQRYKKFIVEGEKSIVEAIKFKLNEINKIYCTFEFKIKYNSLLQGLGDKVTEVTEMELETISNLKNNSTALALMELSENENISALREARIIMYLDGISDPGNLGTIIRSGDWFGIDALICSPDCVDIYNPKVVQATMGSIFRLPVFSFDFDSLGELTDNRFANKYVMLMDGHDIYDFDFSEPMIIIIGNESNGVSRSIIEKSTSNLTIPSLSANVESLNASVAASIVLSEVFRRSRN